MKTLLYKITFLFIITSLSIVYADVTDLDTKALQQLIADKPDLVIIDVRTADEAVRLGGTIQHPNHKEIPRGWFEFRVPEAVANKEAPIVVYCGTNVRSPLAAKTLETMGYSKVYNYASGFIDWKKQKLAIRSRDKAPQSMLYSLPVKVVDGVYSAIGETGPASYMNSGHNNNLSFIVTGKGVVVVNAGDNYLLAKALHTEIKKITNEPVKYVVLENGQGHAMLGSNYWLEQGAKIVAHKDTVTEIKHHAESVLSAMLKGRKDKGMDTKVVMPTITFDDRMDLSLGDFTIELLHLGPAHSPGDILVWLPKQSLIIAGDMAFHQRMLPVFEHTNTAGWLETWKKFVALKATFVIPGHGEATNMAEVTKYTKDYLSFIRGKITEILDNDGELQDAYNIDQSAYRHLATFDLLARQNAGRIFREMEFE
ncbi:MAG: MBL fold metallo-hydrolase [Thiotrichaceae bacterium]|nr:MBL fold metallo-hydrolase [Thiotrichaceae bacterium]